MDAENSGIDWVICGKSVRQLIAELESFEDKDLEVRVSTDEGDTSQSISLVAKIGEQCVLICYKN